MSSFQNLNKLIENLNLKIKKLDGELKSKPVKLSYQTNQNKNINNPNLSVIIKAYSISHPRPVDQNKKYIGLMFDENFNDFTSENSGGSNNKISFIKLKPGNNIINY